MPEVKHVNSPIYFSEITHVLNSNHLFSSPCEVNGTIHTFKVKHLPRSFAGSGQRAQHLAGLSPKSVFCSLGKGAECVRIKTVATLPG